MKVFKHPFSILAFCILLISLFESCRKKESFDVNTSLELQFSVDTLSFDTLFSTLSSTTKYVVIKNPSSKWLKIDRIFLENGQASFFKLNVNGDTSSIVRNLEIAPKDSLYIFIKLTVDPTHQSNPLFIEDHILFEFNRKQQRFTLNAWGQDAYLHKPTSVIKIPYPNPTDPSKIDTQYIYYSIVDCSTPLPNDKPHLIFGYLVVDEGCTLEIPAATKLHFAKDGGLWVYEGGSLKVSGVLNQPVIFDGIRQDDYYKDLPGQWLRIWLSPGSINNEINYAVIKNGTVGLWVDTLGNDRENLIISNTIIKNMSSVGILAQGSKILGSNVVIGNCQSSCMALTLGGSYEFYQSTFANYWSTNFNPTKSLILNDYYRDVTQKIQWRPLEKVK